LSLLLPLGSIMVLYGIGFLFAILDRRSGGLTGLSKIFLNIVSVAWTVFVQIPFSAGVFASIYQRLKAADKDESDRPDSALGNGSNDGVFTD
jgi:hypothetical protein